MAEYLARLTLGSGTRPCAVCSKMLSGAAIQVSNPECREFVLHLGCAEAYQRIAGSAEHAAIAAALEGVSRG